MTAVYALKQPHPDGTEHEWWEKCWRCGRRKWTKDSACVHCGANP